MLSDFLQVTYSIDCEECGGHDSVMHVSGPDSALSYFEIRGWVVSSEPYVADPELRGWATVGAVAPRPLCEDCFSKMAKR